MSLPPKTTSLTETHRAAGARLVEFAGFLMPLQYSGIVDEHRTVRNHAGLFDVSHMGEVVFRGDRALEVVNRLVTNNVLTLQDGQALYTPICNAAGGIVDDCLVYRHAADHLLIVVNASNIDKDYDWFAKHGAQACNIDNLSEQTALLALQGPQAPTILAKLAGQAFARLPRFHFSRCEAAGITCTAARTGYTGEDGYELFCSAQDAPALWSAIVAAGTTHGLKPIGLGARDTLRLEARLLLYGNDIDDQTTPLEAGLAWTVKLKAGDFIGRDALLTQKRDGLTRRLVGLIMRKRGIARHGYAIANHTPNGPGQPIGHITSGTMSPTLGQAIALGYVPLAQASVGTKVLVDIRGKPVPAEVVKGPFYSASAGQ